MPEIGIGLYPDVGASWFLARLPGRLGLFLGLSAAQMNARDASTSTWPTASFSTTSRTPCSPAWCR